MDGFTTGATRRQGWGAGLVATLAAAALVAACGGGGGGGSVGGATALTVGPVAGFGSIIVNGVRFDDSRVRVLDDDGVDVTDDKRVQLGTMVEVDSNSIDDTTRRATATAIRLGSEIKGPVEGLGATANSVVVLGQTVTLTPTTVFDASLAGATPATLVGLIVEVHVLFDSATNGWIATRVEKEDANTSAYKLRGIVANLDTTARTFTIGGATINYTQVADADLPPNFANDLKVRVRLATTKAADGSWSATRIRSGVRKVEDHEEAHLRGTISAFTSATQFEVDGVPVDASQARVQGTVAAGAFVEVEGRTVNGVLLASKVEVKTRGDDGLAEIELHGTPGNVDTTANTFTLRGLNVVYGDTTTSFDRITEAQLAAPNVIVEVKGTLSADRSTLTATRIKRDD